MRNQTGVNVMIEPGAAIGLLGAAGLLPTGAIVVLKLRESAQWSRSLVPYRLQLSGDLKLEEVEQFLSGLSGLRGPHWGSLFAIRGLVFEIVSTEGGIVHRLLIEPSQVGIVETHLRAAMPNVSAVPDGAYKVQARRWREN